jgi:ribosomal-protein-alanine N-acetyltransferase
MSAIDERSITMPYAVRPLEERDLTQSSEIEREAFPTLFPPTSFRRELKNRMARYLVAWRQEEPEEVEPLLPPIQVANAQDRERPLINKLFNNARSLWAKRPSAWEPGQQFIVGFVGAWYMVDEVHIVSIGVRTGFRGRGLGELLLISAMEQALERNVKTVTLEVRASNHVAKNLYKKYGFHERGVRKGYYTDDREDALIMTTDPICTSPYRQEFLELVRAHEQRWGRGDRVMS